MDTPTSPTAATTTLRPSLRSEAGYDGSSRPPALSAWTGAPTLRLTMPLMLRWRRTRDPPTRLNPFTAHQQCLSPLQTLQCDLSEWHPWARVCLRDASGEWLLKFCVCLNEL